MKQISINIGFVTNSSSVVHHFPKELLEHPKIKVFLEKFEIQNGFVSDKLDCRELCASFLVTTEQKEEAIKFISENDDVDFKIDLDQNKFVLIFGDEYSTIVSQLCFLLRRILKE